MDLSEGPGKSFENNGKKSETKEKFGLKEPEQNVEGYTSFSTLKNEKCQGDSASKAFEKILSKVGDYGYYQWKLLFITGVCGLFTSFHNLGAVFLAATPDHWCDIPYLQENSLKHDKNFLNVSVPWVRGKKGTMEPSKCTYYSNDYSSLLTQIYTPVNNISSVNLLTVNDIFPLNTSNAMVTACDSWIYDDSIYKSTAVTEWDLVCDKRWIMSSIQASYMMGILSGAVIFSAVSDKLGRRVSSLICCVLFFVASVSAAFAKSFGVFLVLRFIVAGSGQGMYLVNFILLMETVSLKGRNVMGNLFHVFFAIGFLLLCLFSYLLPEWRHLQLVISVPTIVLLGYYWLLPESPRWLLMSGREEEGLTILRSIAKTNGNPFPDAEELNPLLADIANEVTVEKEKHITTKAKIVSTFKLVVILVRTPNMRRRNLITFYGWFVSSMVSYGLTFNSATFTSSPHISVALMALAGFPSKAVIIFLLWVGRRTVVAACYFGAGLLCITVIFIPVDMVWWNLALITMGKVFINASFSLVFMLSAELVPTHVRNMSIGTASMFARIGSGIAPYIVDLLGDIYYAIPTTTFGVLAILAGLLCLLLPETGKKRLPESIEEIEALPR